MLIPPERVPIGRGTSMFYQNLFYKTLLRRKDQHTVLTVMPNF